MSVVLLQFIMILSSHYISYPIINWHISLFIYCRERKFLLPKRNLCHWQCISVISKHYTAFHASPVTSILKKESSGTCCIWPLHSIHPLFKIKPGFSLWPVLYSPLSTLLTLAKLMRQRSLSASLLSWHERPAHSSLAVIAPLCVSSRKSGSRTPPALALRGNNMLPPTSPMDLRPCHL